MKKITKLKTKLQAAPFMGFFFEIRFSFFCQLACKPRHYWVSEKNRNQLAIFAWLTPRVGGMASAKRKIFFASWLTRQIGSCKI